MNGMLLNDRKVFVGRFKSRKEREAELGLGQKSSPMFTSRILEKTWMMSALRISLASLDLP